MPAPGRRPDVTISATFRHLLKRRPARRLLMQKYSAADSIFLVAMTMDASVATFHAFFLGVGAMTTFLRGSSPCEYVLT